MLQLWTSDKKVVRCAGADCNNQYSDVIWREAAGNKVGGKRVGL